MKCRLHKCRAACCMNIILPIGFLEIHEDKIVNKVIGSMPAPSHSELGAGVFVTTSHELINNKCPFLRGDYKCNVYEQRPQICRIFGVEDHPLMKCQYIKK